MGIPNLTLTVSEVNGVGIITDQNGGRGDDILFQGEVATLTFQPGSGVRAVTSLVVVTPSPLPAGVSVTQQTDGPNCVATDTDTLLSTAQEVDVKYSVTYIRTNGTPGIVDPKLINMPSARPQSVLMARGTSKKPMPKTRPAVRGKAKPVARRAPAKSKKAKVARAR